MALIRDFISGIIRRLGLAVIVLGLSVLVIFSWRLGNEYWDAAAKDINSLEQRAMDAEKALKNLPHSRDYIVQQTRLIDDKRPWELDPRILSWRGKRAIWENAWKINEAATQEVAQTKSALDDAKSGKWRVVTLIRETWRDVVTVRNCLLLVCAAFLLKPAWKVFWYYGVAPLASRAAPVELVQRLSSGSVKASTPVAMHEVSISGTNSFCSRADWVHEFPADSISKRTRFFWGWRSLFISYAAGLSELTEWKSRDGSVQKLKLCSGTDPNIKIVEIKLENHPGLVLRPKHVIAISGNIQLKARWSMFNLHSWLSNRLRLILFAGTGSIYVKGYGNLETDTLTPERRLSDYLLLGFESVCSYRTVRTETFWHYLRGTASLYDIQIVKPGMVIRQTAAIETLKDGQRRSPEGRLQAILELLLKPLGY
jgi:hypothetical protein